MTGTIVSSRCFNVFHMKIRDGINDQWAPCGWIFMRIGWALGLMTEAFLPWPYIIWYIEIRWSIQLVCGYMMVKSANTNIFLGEFHLTNIRGNDWILFGSSNLDLIGLHGILGISKGKIPWNTGYKRWLIISNSGRLYQKRNAAGYWGFGTCPKFHITGAQEGI